MGTLYTALYTAPDGLRNKKNPDETAVSRCVFAIGILCPLYRWMNLKKDA